MVSDAWNTVVYAYQLKNELQVFRVQGSGLSME